jgi:hypothetical protein
MRVNVQVEAHSDGVACDQDVDPAFGIVEARCLFRADLRGQPPIHDGALETGFLLDFSLQVENVDARERDNTVALADAPQVALQTLRRDCKRR